MIELSEALSVYVRRDLKINDDTKTSFTERELAEVSCLSISRDDMNVIKYFKNLSILSLDRFPSLTEDDIKYIGENIKTIFSIKIKEQNVIYNLDLSGFNNLLELALIHNDNLIELKGIDKVNRLTLYDNKEYKNIQQIVDYLNAHPDSRTTLDFVYYVPIVRMLGKDTINSFEKVSWVESLGLRYFKIHDFSKNEVDYVNEFVSNIVGKYLYNDDTEEEKFSILYKWMINNIRFLNEDEGDNKEVLSNTNTYHVFADKIGGRLSYGKAFQILLSYAGIKAEMVYSYGALDSIGFLNGEKVFSLLGTSDYALLRVSLNGKYYYCDIAWDSLVEKYVYSEALRLFLVSKEELSLRHRFVGEGNILHSYSYHGDDSDDLIMFAKARIEEVDNIIGELESIENRLKSIEIDKAILTTLVDNKEPNNDFNYFNDDRVVNSYISNEDNMENELLGTKKNTIYKNKEALLKNYFGKDNIGHEEVIKILQDRLEKVEISKSLFNILSNL